MMFKTGGNAIHRSMATICCCCALAFSAIALAQTSEANQGDAGSPDGGEAEFDLPGPYVDPMHPEPKWVSALNRLRTEQIEIEFDRLGFQSKVEYAVFLRIMQHPPDLEWSFRLAKRSKIDLSALRKMVEREPSDGFASALIDVIWSVIQSTGLRVDETFVRTLEVRVGKMQDPLKWNTNEVVAKIAKKRRKERRDAR